MTLFLASKSETRRHLLEAAGVDFETLATDFAEEDAKAGLLDAGVAPFELADQLAELKARNVDAPEGALVLGADQTLELASGGLLSKAASIEDAREQLRLLAGTVHQLHSAAVIVRDGRRLWGCTQSARLKMRVFGDAFLSEYLEREYDHVRWNVGTYRIEGLGAQLFEDVEGSHFAILGLPLLPLLAYLRELGVLRS